MNRNSRFKNRVWSTVWWSSSSVAKNTTNSSKQAVAVLDKPTKSFGTVRNCPMETITFQALVHNMGPWKVYQAKINDSYYIMVHAETNEKIYLKGDMDEFITSGFGIETKLAWKNLKFVMTNKTKDNELEKDQYIIIDVDTLEKVQINLSDDPTEYIVRRHCWQWMLQWKNVQWFYTNKSGEMPTLIDTDTMSKIDMHVTNYPEDKIITLWWYHFVHTFAGRSISMIPINEKWYFIYDDTLERVTPKDCPTEYITWKFSDTWYHRHFSNPIWWKNAYKFEVNHDENKTYVLDVDTLEKITIKHSPLEFLTDYTICSRHRDSFHQLFVHFSYGYWVDKQVWFANVNHNNTITPIYHETLEKLTLEGHPELVITWLEVSEKKYKSYVKEYEDWSSYSGWYNYVIVSFTINNGTKFDMEIKIDDRFSYNTVKINSTEIANKYQELYQLV